MWENPEVSLTTGEGTERTMLAELLQHLLLLDSDFLRCGFETASSQFATSLISLYSIVEDPSDYTIPLLVRYFRFSKTSEEISETTSSICAMFGAGFQDEPMFSGKHWPEVSRYRKEHPPSATIVHDLVLKGADFSHDLFFVTIASHFRLAIADFRLQVLLGTLLSILYRLVDLNTESGLSYMRSFFRCGHLWKRLFKSTQIPQPQYEDIHVDVVYTLARRCINFKTTDLVLKLEERVFLVRTWFRNGLFDGLDYALPRDFPAGSAMRT